MRGNISNIHSDTCRSIEYARKYLTKLIECRLWKETLRCVTNWINHIRCCALCASWIFVGATHAFRTCQSALFRRMPEDAFPEIQYECNALFGHWLFELQSTQIKYSRDWTSQYHSDGRPHYTKPMARINFNDISFLCDMYSGILYMAFSCNVPIKIAIEHVTGPLEIETSTYCTIPIIFRPVLAAGLVHLFFASVQLAAQYHVSRQSLDREMCETEAILPLAMMSIRRGRWPQTQCGPLNIFQWPNVKSMDNFSHTIHLMSIAFCLCVVFIFY